MYTAGKTVLVVFTAIIVMVVVISGAQPADVASADSASTERQTLSANEITLLLRQAQATRALITIAAASNDPALAAVADELTSVGWKTYVGARARVGYGPSDWRCFSNDVRDAWQAASTENAAKLVRFRLAARDE